MALMTECLPCLQPLVIRSVNFKTRIRAGLKRKISSSDDDSEPMRIEVAQEAQVVPRSVVARVLSPEPPDYDEKPQRPSREHAVSRHGENQSCSVPTSQSSNHSQDARQSVIDARRSSNEQTSTLRSETSGDVVAQEKQVTHEEKETVEQSGELDWEQHWQRRLRRLKQQQELRRQDELERNLTLEGKLKQEEEEEEEEQQQQQQQQKQAQLKQQTQRNRLSDAESEFLYLPMQDTDGYDIRPINSRLDRPPSWDIGVPPWPVDDGAEIVSPTNEKVEADSIPVSPESPYQRGYGTAFQTLAEKMAMMGSPRMASETNLVLRPMSRPLSKLNPRPQVLSWRDSQDMAPEPGWI